MRFNFTKFILSVCSFVFVLLFVGKSQAAGCPNDSVANYFSQFQIESIFKAKIVTAKESGSCADMRTSYTLLFGTLNNTIPLGAPELNIEVRTFINSDAAHAYYQNAVDSLTQNSYGLKLNKQSLSAIADEAVLISGTLGPGSASSFARQGKYVLMVRAGAFAGNPAQYADPNKPLPAELQQWFNEYSSDAVKSKVENLLGAGVGQAKLKNKDEAIVPTTGQIITGKDCGPAEKYFPKSEIESVFGKKIINTILLTAGATKEAGTKESANCRIFFDANSLPTSDNFAASYAIYNSDANAASAAASPPNPANVEMGKVDNIRIGDGGTLWIVGPTSTQPIYMMQIHKGPLLLSIIYWNSNNRSKAEELLKQASQNMPAPELPSPSVSATPSSSQNLVGKAPIITSITHNQKPVVLPAGVFDYFTDDGQAIYKYYYGYITIKGKNLSDAVLSTDNKGNLIGNPAIEFGKINSYNSGATLIAQIIVKTFAKEGTTNITAVNQIGRTNYPITITISGTQYLERTYKDKPVLFRGDWANIAPNKRIADLIVQVNRGLRSIDYPSYKKLYIVPIIYETSYFDNSTVCPPGSGGCAPFSSTVINIREAYLDTDKVASTFLHEAAHKLHFYNQGLYDGVSDAPRNSTKFQMEWLNDVDKAGLKNCAHLPLVKTGGVGVSWKDGTKWVPHCGFIEAYGASDLKNFYEDVATMTEVKVFYSDYFSYGDATKDPRYLEKINTLKKYGFLH